MLQAGAARRRAGAGARARAQAQLRALSAGMGIRPWRHVAPVPTGCQLLRQQQAGFGSQTGPDPEGRAGGFAWISAEGGIGTRGSWYWRVTGARPCQAARGQAEGRVPKEQAWLNGLSTPHGHKAGRVCVRLSVVGHRLWGSCNCVYITCPTSAHPLPPEERRRAEEERGEEEREEESRGGERRGGVETTKT